MGMSLKVEKREFHDMSSSKENVDWSNRSGNLFELSIDMLNKLKSGESNIFCTFFFKITASELITNSTLMTSQRNEGAHQQSLYLKLERSLGPGIFIYSRSARLICVEIS